MNEEKRFSFATCATWHDIRIPKKTILSMKIAANGIYFEETERF